MKYPFRMALAIRTAKALMAPTPQVGSPPAVTSLPDPQQLAEQVRPSIAEGLTNCRQRQQRAEPSPGCIEAARADCHRSRRWQLSMDILMTLTQSKAYLLATVVLLAALTAAVLHLSSLRPGAQTLDCTWSLQVLLSSLMLAMNNNARRLRQQRYISYIWAPLSGIVIGIGLAASPSLTPEGAFGVVLLTLFFIP